MKQTVYFNGFEGAFRDCNRQDNFSYDGLKALYEWLEEVDECCGVETELDVIALCCEFTEYINMAEFQSNYSDDYQTLDDVMEDTFVIPIGDESFIVQDF